MGLLYAAIPLFQATTGICIVVTQNHPLKPKEQPLFTCRTHFPGLVGNQELATLSTPKGKNPKVYLASPLRPTQHPRSPPPPLRPSPPHPHLSSAAPPAGLAGASARRPTSLRPLRPPGSRTAPSAAAGSLRRRLGRGWPDGTPRGRDG